MKKFLTIILILIIALTAVSCKKKGDEVPTLNLDPISSSTEAETTYTYDEPYEFETIVNETEPTEISTEVPTTAPTEKNGVIEFTDPTESNSTQKSKTNSTGSKKTTSTQSPTEKSKSNQSKPKNTPTEAPKQNQPKQNSTGVPKQKATEAPKQKPTEASKPKPTEASKSKPTAAPTQKPTQAPTQKPTASKPTEAKLNITFDSNLFGTMKKTYTTNKDNTVTIYYYIDLNNMNEIKIDSLHFNINYDTKYLSFNPKKNCTDPNESRCDLSPMFPVTNGSGIVNDLKNGKIQFVDTYAMGRKLKDSKGLIPIAKIVFDIKKGTSGSTKVHLNCEVIDFLNTKTGKRYTMIDPVVGNVEEIYKYMKSIGKFYTEVK